MAMLFPNFLTFLANNAALGVLALVAWVVIVGVVVWLGEKQSKNSASASAKQRREPMPQ
jgi:flagellar basal body-associated protein FliL